MSAASMTDARRACIARAGAGGRAAACAGGRRDGAGGVVRCRRGAAGRLLLTIHHLAVDGVSWRILVPDLAAAWAAIADGREPALAPRGHLVPALGAAACGAGAGSQARSASFRSGRGMLSAPSLSLVDGALDPARDISGTAGHLTLTLPAAVTGALLTRVPAAFHGGINDVLLTGLAVAVADWCRRRGTRQPDSAVLLDLEGHGREEIFADVDLSRTVGWFTSLFPVRLDPGALDLDEALAGGPALGRALKTDQGAAARAARQWAWLWAAALSQPRRRRRSLRALPRRRSASTISGALRRRRRRTGRLRAEAVRLAAAAIPRCRSRMRSRSTRSRSMMRDGATADGAAGSWAPALLSEAEVRDLARALVRGAGGAGAPCGAARRRRPHAHAICRWWRCRRTRSSGWRAQYPQIEDILPLSPLQEGLLFHALYDAQAPDVYTVQLVLELRGPLDSAALRSGGAGAGGSAMPACARLPA